MYEKGKTPVPAWMKRATELDAKEIGVSLRLSDEALDEIERSMAENAQAHLDLIHNPILLR